MSPRSYRRPAEHPAKHSSSFCCLLLKQVDRTRWRPPTPPEGVRDPLPVVDVMVSCSLPATTVPASPPPYCLSSRRCFMSSLVCKTVSCNFPSQVFSVAARPCLQVRHGCHDSLGHRHSGGHRHEASDKDVLTRVWLNAEFSV